MSWLTEFKTGISNKWEEKMTYITLRRAVLALAVLGLSFATPAFAGNEAWSSCTESLCIDAPPPDGSGGWSFNSATNTPTTLLILGVPAKFTVTLLQPSSTPFCNDGEEYGSITLTYNDTDFKLSLTDSRGNTGTNPFLRGGVATFLYSGDFFCHTAQSVAYAFTPLSPNPNALVTATITVSSQDTPPFVGGQEVSETFPVEILP
jgi:hypothetical protein